MAININGGSRQPLTRPGTLCCLSNPPHLMQFNPVPEDLPGMEEHKEGESATSALPAFLTTKCRIPIGVLQEVKCHFATILALPFQYIHLNIAEQAACVCILPLET